MIKRINHSFRFNGNKVEIYADYVSKNLSEIRDVNYQWKIYKIGSHTNLNIKVKVFGETPTSGKIETLRDNLNNTVKFRAEAVNIFISRLYEEISFVEFMYLRE